jgi:hypothetical protein
MMNWKCAERQWGGAPSTEASSYKLGEQTLLFLVTALKDKFETIVQNFLHETSYMLGQVLSWTATHSKILR